MKHLKRKNRVFKYTIKGDPIPLSKVAETLGPSQWNEYKQLRFNYIQTIKNQHEKYFKNCCFEEGVNNRRQFVDGPIKLEATFYMKKPGLPGKPPQKKKQGPHTKSPPAYSLFSFIDQTLQGVIYKRDCAITSVKLNKVYDDKPRTEIKITRLKNEKANNKEE